MVRRIPIVAVALALATALAADAQAAPSPKAQDVAAQAHVRHLVSIIGGCFAGYHNYSLCTTVRELTRGGSAPTGLPLVDGLPATRSGAIGVTASTPTSYELRAASRSGVVYRFAVDSSWRVATTCAPAGRAACPGTGRWPSTAAALVLAQRNRFEACETGLDTGAKNHVRMLAAGVDACYATTMTFVTCQTIAQLTHDGTVNTGLSIVDGQPRPGTVAVTSASTTGYNVEALSRTGERFDIVREPAGDVIRACTPAGTPSCRQGTW